jgi:hypothetical protein
VLTLQPLSSSLASGGIPRSVPTWAKMAMLAAVAAGILRVARWRQAQRLLTWWR